MVEDQLFQFCGNSQLKEVREAGVAPRLADLGPTPHATIIRVDHDAIYNAMSLALAMVATVVSLKYLGKKGLCASPCCRRMA